MNVNKLCSGLLALVLLCASAATGSADTKSARALFRRAEALFAKEQYARALELYRQAYRAKPLPGFHFNMGLCERKLGNHREAATHFRSYLRSSKSTRNKPRATELLRESEKALEATKKAEKEEPVPTLAPVATKAPPPPPEPEPQGLRRLRPLYFWSVAALSGTLIIAGTMTGIVALSKSSTFNDPATPKAELQGLKDAGQALRTTSTVTWTLGAVGAAATVVLYFFTNFGGKEATVAAAPTRDGAMLTWGGRF